jgi:hypothetical protein
MVCVSDADRPLTSSVFASATPHSNHFGDADYKKSLFPGSCESEVAKQKYFHRDRKHQDRVVVSSPREEVREINRGCFVDIIAFKVHGCMSITYLREHNGC